MKDSVTTNFANRQLDPVVKYVRSTRGGVLRMLAILNRRTKKKWVRSNLERWLAVEPEKRTQPLFGVGLLLIEIADKMKQEDQAK